MEKQFLKIGTFLIIFFKKLINVFVFFLLISLITYFMDDPQKYPLFMKFYSVEEQLSQPIIQIINQTIPHEISGFNISKELLIVLLIFFSIFLSSLHRKLKYMILLVQEKKEYYNWRKKIEKTASKDKILELDKKFQALHHDKKDRKELLKEFANLKTQLDSMGQTLAFLSIDVVDSTGMKRGEDQHIATYAFDKYNEILLDVLKENGVIKYAMTPDGMMCCFKSVDRAVSAAAALFERLKDFNKNENKLKSDFIIRAGINSGYVYIDKDTPLEQISDRVIDIAGHMQKHAKPNSINIAGSAIEPLRNRIGFSQTNNVIDEQIVYEWKNSAESS